MYHLRLVKGKSYWGVVRAFEKAPDVYVPEKEQAEKLLSSGYFILIDDAAEERKKAAAAASVQPAGQEEKAEETPLIVKLQSMTKADLAGYAGSNGIDITGCKTRDDIFQKVIYEIAQAGETAEISDEENE